MRKVKQECLDVDENDANASSENKSITSVVLEKHNTNSSTGEEDVVNSKFPQASGVSSENRTDDFLQPYKIVMKESD